MTKQIKPRKINGICPICEHQICDCSERGSASILIDLTKGVIKVFHGTDKVLLFEKKAKIGDWDKIWRAIRK
jgi:hypothetical protein